MPDFISRLTSLRLPSWMDKGESNKLLRVCRVWWQWVHSWLNWPLNQLDAATCAVPLLNVLAYQRDISRFNGEPLSLYRKRVQYAFINAADAGSVAGFIAIFERLGIGYVELLERQPDIDWDVILVRVSDSQIASNSDLLMQIIRQYGKTCRRYRFEVITYSGLRIRAGWVGHEYVTYCARSDVATANAAVATTFTASLTGKK
ncbi:phage tail protein [Yersinia mollaretii]|uniref:Phage-like protein n=1 Tax=Yersinia mollaretii TaxID=33060 RepID=A0AA36LM17_YERMO|nr:phage tail protein [Yersinia mollaretii]CNH55921.1 phage-like protein [Yersinia mollaretii]CQD34566.1 phage-like protein [Yersinia mollaretii]